VTFERKLARIEPVVIMKVYFKRRKIAKVFTTHMQDFFYSDFRQLLLKENFPENKSVPKIT